MSQFQFDLVLYVSIVSTAHMMIQGESRLSMMFTMSQRRLTSEATEPLTDLPQLPGCCIIPGFSVEVSHGAVGEVTPAQMFDALLESAVQGALRSLDGVLE